jgi:putative PIN family toxin of toxin-antitoxin system
VPSKIVCDTNTLVSGFLWKGNEYQLLSKVLERKAILFISPALLSEFARVLEYPKLRPFIPNPAELTGKLESIAVFVEPKETVEIIKEDPDDNKVLECGLAAGADIIVSGDNHLLKLRAFKGIPIITTNAALERLGSRI